MARGLSRKDSIKMLVSGFLNDITDSIKSTPIKKFILDKLEKQVYEYKKH